MSTATANTAVLDPLKQLSRLCQEGRLYEVDEWIRQGQPLQLPPGAPRPPGWHSALEVALTTGQHSLALLLLRAGYQPDESGASPLDIVLRTRRRDLLDLLLQFGADPRRVSLWRLFDTYDTTLFERFRAAGVDLTESHQMAFHLAEHAGNKPLFGFAKRSRQDDPAIQRELDMALRAHAHEGNLKGAHLCLWAGADAHARVPSPLYGSYELEPEDEEDASFCTAVADAAAGGHTAILKLLKPNPERVDFDALYSSAKSPGVVELLAAIQPPRNIGAIVAHLSATASLWTGLASSGLSCGDRSSAALIAVLRAGPRWGVAERSQLSDIRRSLRNLSRWELEQVIKTLRDPTVCAPETVFELTRTPAMQRRLKETGLVDRPAKQLADGRRVGRTCGPTSAAVPHSAGDRGKRVPRPSAEALLRRFDRAKLYEEVWREPVLTVAPRYAVSGVYLARVCRALNIPVPKRGHWARVRSGQHIAPPKLPALKP